LLIVLLLYGAALSGAAEPSAKVSAKAPAKAPVTDLAKEPVDPVICDSRASAQTENPDCVEFGAAIGTLGLSWRQQMPDKVRWLMRRDALELCQQNRSEWGDRATALRDGCVFVSSQACTIVTARPVAHAELGNAVRECKP